MSQTFLILRILTRFFYTTLMSTVLFDRQAGRQEVRQTCRHAGRHADSSQAGRQDRSTEMQMHIYIKDLRQA